MDGQLPLHMMQPKRKIIPYDVRKLIKDFWPSRKRRFENMTEVRFFFIYFLSFF